MADRHQFRAKWHDYNGGMYFVTLCCAEKRHLFGEINRSEMHLNECGKIAKDMIDEISLHFPSSQVLNYVIMPNHIHLILFLEDTSGRADPSPTVSNVIGWLKYNITKDVNLPKGQKLFQRSFYDRVIRNRDEHMEICNYITLNPENWENDELYI